LFEEAVFAPSLEPAVNAAVVSKSLRQLVPLAPRTQTEDDAVESLSKIDAMTAPWLRWV